jgi:outer membrane biosynthesis protein TonB
MAAVASIATGAASYVWEDPGDSIMIQVSLDLIERLGAAVQQGLGAGPRGNEIGGILLGRTLPGFGRAVLIEDFELTPCEHLRGASHTLSPKDRRVLGTRLARRAARQVVGYFRSHTRPGMYLDQEDFAVFSNYFPEASQVFLLVRPATEGPAMGGFFFWENGELDRRSTYRQFPFDSARLANENHPITGEKPSVAPVARPVPVLVPKPEGRAPRRLPSLPSLPWMVVPVIGVLFLIAGLFVSENSPAAHETAAAKVSPVVQPLLPEPVPQPATSTPTPPAVQEAATPPAEPVAQAPAAPQPKPAKKPAQKAAAPLPVAVARAPLHEIEPPPALAAPLDRIEPKLAAVLPPRANAAPPLEAEVSYEAPRPGVFRRALHKIEGGGAESGEFVPASPIRKIAPLKPTEAGVSARPVDIKVFIDDSGNVTRAQALTKGSDLASAALSAAQQWQFKPARKHDKPVASEMVLHFSF